MHVNSKSPLVAYREESSPGKPTDEPTPDWDLEEALVKQLAPDNGPQNKKVNYNDSFGDVFSQ